MAITDTISSHGSTHTLYMAGGETFDIPGVRGRMERLEFASGIVLYRLEYEALDDCFLEMQGAFNEPWIGSALHIQGQSELLAPNGNRYTFDPNNAVLMRIDQHGSRFQLFKGQLVRHVGAASTLKTLRERLCQPRFKSLTCPTATASMSAHKHPAPGYDNWLPGCFPSMPMAPAGS